MDAYPITLAELDEALSHMALSWQVARNAHQHDVAQRDADRIDALLEQRTRIANSVAMIHKRPRADAPA